MPDPRPTPVPRTACVVGGGPAGAVSAAVLARHGWQVTLAERQPLPRTKCCGECLVPRAAAWLAELGLGEALEQARAAGLAPTTVGSRAGWSFTFERCTDDHTLAPEGTIELILFGSAYVGLVRRGDAVHMAAIVERGDRWPTAPAEALRMMATRAPQLARFLAHYEASQPMPALEAACGPLPWKPRAVTAGRVALVGDAAGYAEPYTGEGMGWAIEGAMLLGECFRDGWTAAAAAEYQRQWRATVGRAQAHTLRVGMLLRGGRVAAHATRAAVKMAPWAARRASEIVVGA